MKTLVILLLLLLLLHEMLEEGRIDRRLVASKHDCLFSSFCEIVNINCGVG